MELRVLVAMLALGAMFVIFARVRARMAWVGIWFALLLIGGALWASGMWDPSPGRSIAISSLLPLGIAGGALALLVLASFPGERRAARPSTGALVLTDEASPARTVYFAACIVAVFLLVAIALRSAYP